MPDDAVKAQAAESGSPPNSESTAASAVFERPVESLQDAARIAAERAGIPIPLALALVQVQAEIGFASGRRIAPSIAEIPLPSNVSASAAICDLEVTMRYLAACLTRSGGDYLNALRAYMSSKQHEQPGGRELTDASRAALIYRTLELAHGAALEDRAVN